MRQRAAWHLRSRPHPFEQKMSWILRLEDQRVLRDPAPRCAACAPRPFVGRGSSRRRRHAASSASRSGADALGWKRRECGGAPRLPSAASVSREGVQPLVALLTDADPEVRQMAAFALGLIGDKRARDPLVAALGDPSPLVQGSAAEALGLIGDPRPPTRSRRLAAHVVASGALASRRARTPTRARCAGRGVQGSPCTRSCG